MITLRSSQNQGPQVSAVPFCPAWGRRSIPTVPSKAAYGTTTQILKLVPRHFLARPILLHPSAANSSAIRFPTVPPPHRRLLTFLAMTAVVSESPNEHPQAQAGWPEAWGQKDADGRVPQVLRRAGVGRRANSVPRLVLCGKSISEKRASGLLWAQVTEISSIVDHPCQRILLPRSSPV
jgi:hypothetical protein